MFVCLDRGLSEKLADFRFQQNPSEFISELDYFEKICLHSVSISVSSSVSLKVLLTSFSTYLIVVIITVIVL